MNAERFNSLDFEKSYLTFHLNVLLVRMSGTLARPECV